MTKHILNKFLFSIFIISLLSSCESDEKITYSDKTVIVYMAADNNLETEAFNNINEMERGLPNNDCNLIVYIDSRREAPKLLKIIKDNTKDTVSQTIATYSEQNSIDPRVMQNVLTDIKAKYPSESYALVLWSHATAWLPPNTVKTRSFGRDKSNEMDIKELARALPMKLDYIIFDACLMGSVEACYELKDKTPYILASSLEVLASGLPYEQITPLFFSKATTKEKLRNIGKKYIEHYKNKKKKAYQSAGIALIHTPELDALASKTRQLLLANPLPSWQYNHKLVQKLDLYKTTLIYDFYDFLEKNYDKHLLKEVKTQLDKTVLYKEHTPYFVDKYPILNFCGLSCYIPSRDNAIINSYYTTLKWSNESGFNSLIK